MQRGISIVANAFMVAILVTVCAGASFELQNLHFGFAPWAAWLMTLFGLPTILFVQVSAWISRRWGLTIATAIGAFIAAIGLAIANANTLGNANLPVLLVVLNLLTFAATFGLSSHRNIVAPPTSQRPNGFILAMPPLAGATVGALAAALAWPRYGMHGVCLIGGAWTLSVSLCVVALAYWDDGSQRQKIPADI